MQLYHFRGARSSRVLWLAHEIGAELKVNAVNMFEQEQKKPEYLAINPHAAVPAFTDDNLGVTLVESGAICAHLLDKCDRDFQWQPKPGTAERALFHQWNFYATATLDDLTVGTYIEANFIPEPHRNQKRIDDNKKRWDDVVAPFIAKGLGDKDYILGDFTASDVFVGYDIRMAGQLGWLEDGSALSAYLERLKNRDAYKKSF